MDPSQEEEFIDSDEKKEQESSTKGDGTSPSGGPVPEDLQKKYEELNDRFLRLAADFDNYRKRMERETRERTRYALEAFATELLEVADNF